MDSTEHYADWKAQIRSELTAMEGHGPPSDEELWDLAGHEARGASEWIEDMPLTDSAIGTAKGDVLTALVALEMAQERVSGEGGDAE